MHLSLIVHPYKVYVTGVFSAAFTNWKTAIDTAWARGGEVQGPVNADTFQVAEEWSRLQHERKAIR